MNSTNTKTKTAISPTRAENYPEWYLQVIKAADLAENSPARGCMTIKPWGYAIWENIQRNLDRMIKATGHKNVYFPLLIPLSFFQKESEHIDGFAKECAVVTHHRLGKDADGNLIPAGPLEEPYVIRPTSETIIGEAFARWIQSHRDLPLLINQWANIVRWEMRTRLFLRTTEFLWQEGHTAHATAEEAQDFAIRELNVYTRLVEDYLAMPVIQGEKSESERFPGASSTYTIEAMMQDRKALQAGTAHFLGQHFSRTFNIKFLSAESKEEYVYTTSWGASTRLIGGLIMTHSDDDGLVLPPRIAPLHVIILPILHKDTDREDILNYCNSLAEQLRNLTYHTDPICVEIDTRELTGGEKAWSWVKKGVPFRVEIGKKECDHKTVYVGQRDKPYKDRASQTRDEFVNGLVQNLDEMQTNLLARAKTFQQNNTVVINTKDEFYTYFAKTDCGFALAHWNGDAEIEAKIKSDLSVTTRCIPFEKNPESGKCIFTGEPSKQRVIFAKAY